VCCASAFAAYRLYEVVNPAAVRARQEQALPVRAVEYLNAARPPGPLFNCYSWGGYLMFFAPEYPVSVDGRTDLYRDFVFDVMGIWSAADGWEAKLAGVNLVVVEADSPLAGALRQTPSWEEAHRDERAAVFRRTNLPAATGVIP
jgi:hypothetical protein